MGNKYKVIGIMSGTSLDGLDIAYCEFKKKEKFNKAHPSFGIWKHKIIHAETKKYTKEWKEKLSEAFRIKKTERKKLDKEYGKFIGNEILKFIKRKKIHPDFISSHGHTVFHQPEKKITLQIGDSSVIVSMCQLPVVCDFRSGDVALGGQGAPLVPIVDKLLFSEYYFCLNLGGIANISFDNSKDERVAFDICPVNIVLNNLANVLGKEFDREGKIALKGKVNHELLQKLNALSFYKIQSAKSLGREWVEKKFLPILNSFSITIQDKLRTVCEHIAIQISFVVNSQFSILSDKKYISRTCLRDTLLTAGKQVPSDNFQLLITGGGAYNKFLIERIFYYTKCKIILPDDKTIQFKEAMAFALLGLLKMQGEINILKSVTGAKSDSSGGRIYPA